MPAVFHVRAERIDLHTNVAEVGTMAAQLWHAGPPDGEPSQSTISLRISVVEGPGTPSLPEALLVWRTRDEGFELDVGSALRGALRFDRREATLTLTGGLLDQAPSFVMRTALEAPAAAFLARGAFVALHAAAVSGPRGAVVLRGSAGTGKSTLAAAAAARGLQVLGDESVLVARDDADAIVASVREVAIRADAASLVGLRESKFLTSGESQRKIWVALPAMHRPEDRIARRVATWILGPRDTRPARLLPLSREAFAEAFRNATTPEELVGGAAVDHIMTRWSLRPVWRLEGATDLAGAIECLRATVS